MEVNKFNMLVLDREKLEKNSFWKLLVDRVKEQRHIALGMLENEISASLEKVRFYQGQLAAWQLFRELPDLILSDLSKEEEKESE